jgi:flavin-dependent dehydrogenase
MSVVIVGAGPAGIAAAIACANAGLSVTLMDRGQLDEYRPGEHLAALGRTRLRALGIDERSVAAHVRECAIVESRWGRDERLGQDAIFDPHGSGWLLARPGFDRALAEHAVAVGVKLQLGERVSGREQLSQCEIVIDASGRSSTLAEHFGARRIVYDQLVGISAVRELDAAREGVLVESAPDGWWYSAALPDNRLICTYMTDADLVHPAGGPAQAWATALQRTVDTRARWGSTPPREVLTRPARTQVLDRVVGERWLAIGDAALARDPLSSQGIAAALDAGLRAAELVREMLAGREPAVDHDLELLEYLRERARVYRLEQRFADREFWRRRHADNWATITLRLDPQMWCSPPDERAIATVVRYCPGVDVSRLRAAIGAGGQAVEVASRLRVGSHLHDRELLIALQMGLADLQEERRPKVPVGVVVKAPTSVDGTLEEQRPAGPEHAEADARNPVAGDPSPGVL